MPIRVKVIVQFVVAVRYQIKENNMANPLGIVARYTRSFNDTASDYFKKFNDFMKSGSIDRVANRCF